MERWVQPSFARSDVSIPCPFLSVFRSKILFHSIVGATHCLLNFGSYYNLHCKISWRFEVERMKLVPKHHGSSLHLWKEIINFCLVSNKYLLSTTCYNEIEGHMFISDSSRGLIGNINSELVIDLLELIYYFSIYIYRVDIPWA
jgi:hypothetical protein